jgi:hypothetical protein
MTEGQQKEERLAAWDDYRAAREKLLALRARICRWSKPLGDIYSRVFSNPSNAHEDDLSGLPTQEEYAATVREMKQAHREFLNLRKQAVAFGFAVEPDELLIS